MRSSVTPERFRVGRASGGVGEGLFAATLIAAGDFLLEYTGPRISAKESDASPSRYLFEVDTNWTIDGTVPGNLAGYINHACAPNAEAQLENGRVMIYAARLIRQGEEITIDYGPEYFDEFIKPVGCKCLHCRSAGSGAVS